MARDLARLLDAGNQAGRGVDTYHKLSPRMIAVLRELGGTPATGRRSDPEADEDDDGGRDQVDDELDELTRRADDRSNRAADMDATPP